MEMEREMEMEELRDEVERLLCVDDAPRREEEYGRLRQEGKEAAQRGDLERSLELFRQAYKLQPSTKLQSRIQRLQEAIRELKASQEEEEEEFVNVNNSGLLLYKELYDKLYEHQKEGVAFLYSLRRDGRKGGILADDMGLGKTVQVISFLSGMYDAELANHTLLVMPTSLIKNWVREFAKWTPGMRVKEFHGTSKAERSRNLERIQRKGGAIITTYQMLINNWEQLSSFEGREFHWDYVILDEAHKIKSSSTKTAKCAHAIPARHRLLLTGTPVQNNLREMWALFDFACQGSLLGSAKTFKTEYENPITRAREKDATPSEAALGLKISQNLTELIRPYFLRRTKAEVQHMKQQQQHRQEAKRQEVEEQENRRASERKFAEMPSLTHKNDLIVWTYLSPVQEDIYNQFISLDHIKQLLTTTRSPLAELTVLKKICDHPRLLSARAVAQLGLEEGSNVNDDHPAPQEEENASTASSIDHVPDKTLIEESGKLCFLVSLLESLREEGHRTLIFSQSRKMLDIMERVLLNRNFRLVRVDGTVTQLAEREKRISLFQTDHRYSVFLLTTQVGGVGITLTAANRVVIFDPSWNPATDAQAVDRAYRIGQTENVIVYRLITCGTVEEKIYRRQVFKDSLIRQSTGDKKNPFRYFSKQELKELFTLGDTRSSSTQLQLQALHAQQRRSDPGLDRHIAQLHAMEMFGISDHDLLFSKEAAADEDALEDAESHRYIQARVQKAEELVRAESELQGQLMESVARDTEPAWLRLAKQREAGESSERERRRRTPQIVDLTQSGSEDFVQSNEETGELDEPSHPRQEQNISENNDKSILSADKDTSGDLLCIAAEMSRQDDHVIVLEESDIQSSRASTADIRHEDGDVSPRLQRSPALGSTDTARSLEDDAVLAEMEGFQGNFNLQLEDSADMFSCEEDVDEEEEEAFTGDCVFKLQMDMSGDELADAGQNGDVHEDAHHLPAQGPSVLLTSAEESLLQPRRTKKKAQVLCDSEEEEEVEKPTLASSPLAANLKSLGSSTPKSAQRGNVSRRCSINLSVASRRSLVESLLEDLEEEEGGEEEEERGEEEEEGGEEEERGEEEEGGEEEEEGGEEEEERGEEEEERGEEEEEGGEEEEEGGEEEERGEEEEGGEEEEEGGEEEERDSTDQEWAKGITDESLEEEQEPSGETLNSEDMSEGDGGEEEEQSVLEESTGELELASSENMEQFASKMSPEPEAAPETTPEEAFRLLVRSGKRCLAEGRKEEALDSFLKAIDMNNRDEEIQLLIIQLYRQLSTRTAC